MIKFRVKHGTESITVLNHKGSLIKLFLVVFQDQTHNALLVKQLEDICYKQGEEGEKKKKIAQQLGTNFLKY